MSSCRAAPDDYQLLVTNYDFQKVAKDALAKHRKGALKVASTGCCIVGKPGNKGKTKGYPSCKLAHSALKRQKVEFYLHVLAGMESTGWAQGPAKGHDASHLCHNSKCIAAGHVRMESSAQHDLRDGCKGKERVTFTCEGCETSKTYDPCSHDPACILPEKQL